MVAVIRRERIDLSGTPWNCKHKGREAVLLEIEGPLAAPKRVYPMENGVQTDYPFDFANTSALLRFADGKEERVPYDQVEGLPTRRPPKG